MELIPDGEYYKIRRRDMDLALTCPRCGMQLELSVLFAEPGPDSKKTAILLPRQIGLNRKQV